MANFSDNLRGSILMMASMAAFVFNDACMKALSDELPLFQAVFIRGVITSLAMYLLARQTGGLKFRFERPDGWLVAIRSLAEIAASYFFITALFNMPLANATAILQALPLTVTLAGALFLGETIGWRRLSAILFGFVGVMLIIQPGTQGFSIYSIYVVLAVVVVTIRDISARKLSRGVPSLSVALIASIAVTTFAGLASLSDQWIAPSPLAWAQLLAASLFIIGGYTFSVMTMRIGDIGAVTPFRYTSLLWALLLGFVVFNDWPDMLSLVGSVIIVASGVFTLMRGRKVVSKSGGTA